MILVHSPFVPTPDSDSLKSKDKQKNFEDMVAYMDKVVGQIVQTTEDLGIAERTLILFTGDNGTHETIQSELDGRVINRGKGETTDAGTRVPLVALWPGKVPAGKTSDTLIDFSDFLPTLLEATSQKIPAGLDGQSCLPQLRGGKGTPREWMYCYYNPRPERTKPTRFVRNQRWKLYGDGRLCDVANDVLEKSPVDQDTAAGEATAARKKLATALNTMPAEGQSLLKYGK